MEPRPVILLSTRVTEETNYVEKRSAIAYDYVTYFERLGYTVVPVPCNTINVSSYYDLNPTAVVLTGGNTISNGDEEAGKLAGVFSERDKVETEMLTLAIKEKLPVLGICRGMQLINRHFGGRIEHGIQNHIGKEHPLVSESCTELDSAVTNSFHRDGIPMDGVGDGLQVIAITDDGMVEALTKCEANTLGIQWHPERQSKAIDDKIIQRLFKEKTCPQN